MNFIGYIFIGIVIAYYLFLAYLIFSESKLESGMPTMENPPHPPIKK